MTTITTTMRARAPMNPWLIVLGSGIATAFGTSTIVASFGLFVLPQASELGLSRTIIGSAYSAAAIGLAIGLLIVGRLLDRFAIRWILVPGFAAFGLAVASISLVPANPVLYLLPYFLAGFFGAGMFIPFSKVVVSWFDNRRATAMGIVAAIGALGSALVPLVVGPLIAALGWRGAYLTMGLTSAVVGVTCSLIFAHVRAERSVRGRLVKETVEGNQTISLEVPGLTLQESLRTRYFWQFVCSICVVPIAVLAIQIHLVPMVIQRGLARNDALLLLSLFAVGAFTGRLLGGILIDRIHASIVGAVVILLPAIGAFMLEPPFALAAAGVLLIGFGYGVEWDLTGFLISRYLGLKAFGQLLGAVNAVLIALSSIGPLLAGLAYDTLGSYDAVMPIAAGVLVFASIMILTLGKYKYPQLKGFDRIAAKDELAAAKVLSELAEKEEGMAKSAA